MALAVNAEQRLRRSIPQVRQVGGPSVREFVGEQEQTSVEASPLIMVPIVVRDVIRLHPDRLLPVPLQPPLPARRGSVSMLHTDPLYVNSLPIPWRGAFLRVHAELIVEDEQIERVTEHSDNATGDRLGIGDAPIVEHLTLPVRGTPIRTGQVGQRRRLGQFEHLREGPVASDATTGGELCRTSPHASSDSKNR